MKSIISESKASILLIAILSILIVFHFLLLVNIVPYRMVWGGRIQNKSQLIKFEALSIFINLLMIIIVLLRARVLKISFIPTVPRIAVWIMFAIFILNTIGNLLSINLFEKVIFTPVTLILSFLSLRLALSK